MLKKNKKNRFLPICFLVLVFLTACGAGQAQPDALNWPVVDFAGTNQDGRPLTLADLEGKVWLADFIFTNCETVCPPMTANMANVQEALKEAGVDVTIVSFSVDPEVDTPEKLRVFGEKFDADFSNWHFLTGYTFEQVVNLSQESFKAPVQKVPDSDQVMHGTSFYLIDPSGKIVSRYDGLQPPTEEMIEDIRSYL